MTLHVITVTNRISVIAAVFAALSVSGCSQSTKASGLVTDSFGMPLESVEITLEHSQKLKRTVMSNHLGQYSVRLEEECLLVCAGGNPSLIFVKQDYETVQTQVDQLESTCVDVLMRVLGGDVQQSGVTACSN